MYLIAIGSKSEIVIDTNICQAIGFPVLLLHNSAFMMMIQNS